MSASSEKDREIERIKKRGGGRKKDLSRKYIGWFDRIYQGLGMNFKLYNNQK